MALKNKKALVVFSLLISLSFVNMAKAENLNVGIIFTPPAPSIASVLIVSAFGFGILFFALRLMWERDITKIIGIMIALLVALTLVMGAMSYVPV